MSRLIIWIAQIDVLILCRTLVHANKGSKTSILIAVSSGQSSSVGVGLGAKRPASSQLFLLAQQGQKKKKKRVIDYSVPIITEENLPSCASTRVPVFSNLHLILFHYLSYNWAIHFRIFGRCGRAQFAWCACRNIVSDAMEWFQCW